MSIRKYERLFVLPVLNEAPHLSVHSYFTLPFFCNENDINNNIVFFK